MQTCKDLMTESPAYALTTDTADKAAKLMKTHDVGSIPVVDNQHKLAGIITDRDLALKIVAEHRPANSTKLEQIMTPNPVTCGKNDNIQKALDAMAHYQIRRIPVVDINDRLVGIIAQADVARCIEDFETTAQVVVEISKPATAGVG